MPPSTWMSNVGHARPPPESVICVGPGWALAANATSYGGVVAVSAADGLPSAPRDSITPGGGVIVTTTPSIGRFAQSTTWILIVPAVVSCATPAPLYTAPIALALHTG